MRRSTRAVTAAAAVIGAASAGVGTAQAQGATVGGSGIAYYLNDGFTGKANLELTYGLPGEGLPRVRLTPRL